jgi:hypothetical protein
MASGDADIERRSFVRELERLITGVYRSADYGFDAAGHMWGPDPEKVKIIAKGLLRVSPFEEGEQSLIKGLRFP